MHPRGFRGAVLRGSVLAAALSVSAVTAALAGGVGHGGGGHGGPVFHAGGGFHAARGGWGSGARPGAPRGVPPIAGIIHERAGARPYFSSYGHTDTALRIGGFTRGGVPSYGHTATALRSAAGLRLERDRRFAGRRGYGGYLGGGGGFDGGYADGGYGAGVDDGAFGGGGTYGQEGTYGQAGTYGQPGTYGGLGTTDTQSVYGTGDGSTYRSEVPLAARFAEPPLGPSPGEPYNPGDRYAYAASADVRPAPHVVNPFRRTQSVCACEARNQPIVYRYGVGTAY